MRDLYLWADEAGDFTFRRGHNISRYFILCTVATKDLDVGDALCDLRRKMVWDGTLELSDMFHATADKQSIRDRVFAAILKHDFRVQATICEKSKAQPQVRTSKPRFYKYPWFYQFKHGVAPHLKSGDRLLVTAASIGTKKEKLTFTTGLKDVVQQSARTVQWAVDFRSSQSEPCLQLADYCAWAIQRKWEAGDTRSYDLIKPRISYEYELWESGIEHYY